MAKTQYNRYPGRVHVNLTRKGFDPYKNPKQVEAWKDPHDFILFGGAMGGSKTYWLIADCLKYMHMYPDNRGVLVRKTRGELKKNLIPSFEEVCNPRVIKKFNRSDLEVTFRNGSKLYFMEAATATDKQFERFKGMEVGWFGIDEASEVPYELYEMLRTRLRWKAIEHPGWKRVGRLTSNPEICWLYDRFVLNPKESETYIQSLTLDNYSKDDPYYIGLLELFEDNPNLKERYLEGIWDIKEAINQLIGNDILRVCYEPSYRGNRKGIGIDPARFGDDESIIQVIRNSNALTPEVYNKVDGHDLADRVAILMKEHDISDDQVACDGGGGYGSSCIDRLRRVYKHKNVHEIIGSSKPVETDNMKILKPFNFRSQLFLQLKEDEKDGTLGGVNDNGLREEHSAIKYFMRPDGKIQIIDKKQIKQFFGKSPGKVEALSYGNWVAGGRKVKKTGVRRIA